MTRRDEQLAAAAAHEAAGWNSPPAVPVWAVSPDLTGSFDEVYFESLDDAVEYISDNVCEKISCDCAEGFDLRLWKKLISREQYDAVFGRGERKETKQCR